MEHDVIHLNGSPWRRVGLAIFSFTTASAGVWLLWKRPEPMAPGSLVEFLVYILTPILAFGAVWSIWKAFQTGPVVSVSREGLFDRRVSTAPIPWSAIVAIKDFRMRGQATIASVIVDPAQEAELPLLPVARRNARICGTLYGQHGYWVPTADLIGGRPALDAALMRFRPGSEAQSR